MPACCRMPAKPRKKRSKEEKAKDKGTDLILLGGDDQSEDQLDPEFSRILKDLQKQNPDLKVYNASQLSQQSQDLADSNSQVPDVSQLSLSEASKPSREPSDSEKKLQKLYLTAVESESSSARHIKSLKQRCQNHFNSVHGGAVKCHAIARFIINSESP